MSSNSTTPQDLPNPLTPLAWVPPDLASQFEVSRYLYAVSLGIYLWDVFLNLPNDYKLLVKYRFGMSTLIYFASRVATLAYILTSFVFQVAPVAHCQALQIALGVCFVASLSMTSLLFYLRLRAVFFGDKIIQMIFGVFWLAVAGASITVPVGISGSHIGPTQQCINTRVESYTVAALIVPLINDSAVFLAISYRILTYHMVENTFAARAKAFVGRGGTIPNLSRALLSSGQYYYLVAVCGNIVLVVMLETKGLPPVYHAMCTIPVLAVINIMACIVYRKVRFGLITYDGTIYTRTTMDMHAAVPSTRISSGRNAHYANDSHRYPHDASDISYSMKHIRSDEPTALEVVVVKESQNVYDPVR